MWGGAIRHYERFLQAAGRAPGTIRLRLYYVGRLARFAGDPDPWGIGVDKLIEFLADPAWKPETRKNARAAVAGFYGWAVDTDRITERENPARRLPSVSVGRALPRPVPSEVFARALWRANHRDRLFLLFAGYAGLRRAEIARVEPGDLDRDRQLLRVRGKGRKDRPVPLHPALLSEIDAELERRRAGSCGTGWRYTSYVTPDGPLFPGRVGHVGPDVPGKVLAQLLGDGWTAHTLRHRFASQAYAVDRDLRATQELLGHSKPETTARYVATPDGALRAAVMGAGLEGVGPDAA